MSVLADKSDQNFKAALLTRDSKLFSPSIHAAYYSCLQKMLFILERDYTTSYEHIVQWCREKGTSIHNHCIDSLSEELRKKDKGAAASFKGRMRDLKGFRENSDYSSKEVLEHHVKDAHSLCNEIHKLINKHF